MGRNITTPGDYGAIAGLGFNPASATGEQFTTFNIAEGLPERSAAPKRPLHREVTMNIRKVLLLALCLTVPAAAAGSDRTAIDAAQLPVSEVPYLEQAALVANTENSFRMLVPADEMLGISQILALVEHTDFEEQWVFVPSINLWIEIGRNESVSELDSEVEVDTDYLSEIVSLYHSVAIFHFHPAGFYRRVWQHELYPISFPAGAIERGQLQPVGFALPSPNDVVSSIELSRMLLAKDPAAHITYGVVSPHGVVTYGPTAPGLQTIVYDWGNPRATTARSIVTRIAIRRMPFNIASTVDALGSPTISEVIEALCEQASDENYRLSFRPF